MAEESILAQIIETKRREIAQTRGRLPLELVRERASERTERREFARAISGPGLAVIAEIKKASPSRGIIRQDYKPREIARAYQEAGASALSVLTEERYFQGSLDHLAEVSKAARLPVLRKDFILDEYQVYESAAAGADALLLIVAALDDSELQSLLSLSRRLRISVLVEVHTEQELERALDAGAEIIGVNNRNLKTLEVDIETSFRLRKEIPEDKLAVSESGIKTPEHLRRLQEAGFDAVLIGEHFLLAGDPGAELSRLLGDARRVKIE